MDSFGDDHRATLWRRKETSAGVVLERVNNGRDRTRADMRGDVPDLRPTREIVRGRGPQRGSMSTGCTRG